MANICGVVFKTDDKRTRPTSFLVHFPSRLEYLSSSSNLQLHPFSSEPPLFPLFQKYSFTDFSVFVRQHVDLLKEEGLTEVYTLVIPPLLRS